MGQPVVCEATRSYTVILPTVTIATIKAEALARGITAGEFVAEAVDRNASDLAKKLARSIRAASVA